MTRRLPEGAPIVTAAAMRAAEDAVFASGVSQDALMERAGTAVAVQVARLAAGRPVLVLAGPGNNGGDAWVVAGWLAARGHDVAVAAIDGRAEGAAARMRGRWRGSISSLAAAAPRPILVDGLFGTGLSRPLDAEVAVGLTRLRAAAALTVAIDVSSGFGSDDGVALGGVGADVTIALGALKPAHLLGAGGAACGHVLLADISVSLASEWRTLERPVIAPPQPDDHKFSRGMIAVVSGAMPGAARLAARAAMCGGAGYVVLAGEDRSGPDALVCRPADDGLFADGRIGALVIGPGLGRDEMARNLLERALASRLPLVLDGDALSLLGAAAADRLRDRDAILTPHSGEFDRMFGTGCGSKIDRSLAAARACGCTIVHKGADTVIARPDGRAVVAGGASPWLATAGTGDVLAGTVAARLAAGVRDPAAEAVWLHARAAVLAGPVLIADDLPARIGQALAECLTKP
ncbi:NAD(P)H-hydrate epimerase [Sphingomonas sp.]|uniref:NAD(P)H-hydrate epimerase n=1 Tax=Sphingomonas sp. TaxID=28214 RepID=UPI002DD64B31|nr:NAD(P)H-hydrate epimerase [Sphingomonas sp.]